MSAPAEAGAGEGTSGAVGGGSVAAADGANDGAGERRSGGAAPAGVQVVQRERGGGPPPSSTPPTQAAAPGAGMDAGMAGTQRSLQLDVMLGSLTPPPPSQASDAAARSQPDADHDTPQKGNAEREVTMGGGGGEGTVRVGGSGVLNPGEGHGGAVEAAVGGGSGSRPRETAMGEQSAAATGGALTQHGTQDSGTGGGEDSSPRQTIGADTAASTGLTAAAGEAAAASGRQDVSSNPAYLGAFASGSADAGTDVLDMTELPTQAAKAAASEARSEPPPDATAMWRPSQGVSQLSIPATNPASSSAASASSAANQLSLQQSSDTRVPAPSVADTGGTSIALVSPGLADDEFDVPGPVPVSAFHDSPEEEDDDVPQTQPFDHAAVEAAAAAEQLASRPVVAESTVASFSSGNQLVATSSTGHISETPPDGAERAQLSLSINSTERPLGNAQSHQRPASLDDEETEPTATASLDVTVEEEEGAPVAVEAAATSRSHAHADGAPSPVLIASADSIEADDVEEPRAEGTGSGLQRGDATLRPPSQGKASVPASATMHSPIDAASMFAGHVGRSVDERQQPDSAAERSQGASASDALILQREASLAASVHVRFPSQTQEMVDTKYFTPVSQEEEEEETRSERHRRHRRKHRRKRKRHRSRHRRRKLSRRETEPAAAAASEDSESDDSVSSAASGEISHSEAELSSGSDEVQSNSAEAVLSSSSDDNQLSEVVDMGSAGTPVPPAPSLVARVGRAVDDAMARLAEAGGSGVSVSSSARRGQEGDGGIAGIADAADDVVDDSQVAPPSPQPATAAFTTVASVQAVKTPGSPSDASSAATSTSTRSRPSSARRRKFLSMMRRRGKKPGAARTLQPEQPPRAANIGQTGGTRPSENDAQGAGAEHRNAGNDSAAERTQRTAEVPARVAARRIPSTESSLSPRSEATAGSEAPTAKGPRPAALKRAALTSPNAMPSQEQRKVPQHMPGCRPFNDSENPVGLRVEALFHRSGKMELGRVTNQRVKDDETQVQIVYDDGWDEWRVVGNGEVAVVPEEEETGVRRSSRRSKPASTHSLAALGFVDDSAARRRRPAANQDSSSDSDEPIAKRFRKDMPSVARKRSGGSSAEKKNTAARKRSDSVGKRASKKTNEGSKSVPQPEHQVAGAPARHSARQAKATGRERASPVAHEHVEVDISAQSAPVRGQRRKQFHMAANKRVGLHGLATNYALLAVLSEPRPFEDLVADLLADRPIYGVTVPKRTTRSSVGSAPAAQAELLDGDLEMTQELDATQHGRAYQAERHRGARRGDDQVAAVDSESGSEVASIVSMGGDGSPARFGRDVAHDRAERGAYVPLSLDRSLSGRPVRHSRVFSGLSFLTTGFHAGNGERACNPARSGASTSVAVERCSNAAWEGGQGVPTALQLNQMIERGGGKIVSFDEACAMRPRDLRNVITIARPSMNRTFKYMLSIARGVPPLHYRWVLHNMRAEKVPSCVPYELPTGIDLEGNAHFVPATRIQVQGVSASSESARIPVAHAGKARVLEGMVIGLVVPAQKAACWANVVKVAGASGVILNDENEHALPDGADIVVVELEPSTKIPAVVIKAVEVRGVDIVSTDWLAHCFVMQSREPIDHFNLRASKHDASSRSGRSARVASASRKIIINLPPSGSPWRSTSIDAPNATSDVAQSALGMSPGRPTRTTPTRARAHAAQRPTTSKFYDSFVTEAGIRCRVGEVVLVDRAAGDNAGSGTKRAHTHLKIGRIVAAFQTAKGHHRFKWRQLQPASAKLRRATDGWSDREAEAGVNGPSCPSQLLVDKEIEYDSNLKCIVARVVLLPDRFAQTRDYGCSDEVRFIAKR